MKTKKLHNSFSKALVITVIAFFVLVASSITNSLSAKDAFIWNGSTSNDWVTTTNWTITRGAVPGTSTFPGEVGATDSVVVSNGGTPSLASGSLTISTLTVSNATGASSGSTLTISNGATLAVNGTGTVVIPTVLLKGGNIVNNGTFTITAAATGAGYGIICTTPVVAPGSATTYSYSGSGSLSINTSAGTGSSVYFNGTNANSTYKIAFPSSSTLILKANAAALNVASNTTSPVLISGTGFTLGTSGTGVAAGILLQNGNGTNVTIDSGTTLTLYSLTGNTAKGVYLNFSTAGGGSFTNNGTININGPMAGCFNLTNSAGSGTNNLSFTNNGVISANVAISGTYSGAMNLVTQAANGTNTNTITNAGTMTLVNTSSVANTGYCLYHGNTTYTSGSLTSTITNSGTFELNGTFTSTGGTAGRLTINNTGTFILNPPTSGTSCLDKAIFNNNSGGILDCKTATISSGSGYVVTLNSGSTLKTASPTSYCLSGSGAVQNSGVSYVLNGAVAQTTGSYIPASINDLTINNALGVTLGSTVTVNGTLTLTTGAFTIGVNTLTLKGVAANNGGTLTHYSKGSLIFSGSTAQNFPSLTNNKCKLVTLNNAAGVSLNASIAIDSTLTLTSGKLSLGVNDLTIGTKGSIAGTSSSNYIITDGVGKLNQTVVATVPSLLFPVGASASSYDPVSVTPTTLTSFAVKAYTTLSGTPAYGVRYNPKEWDITPVVASSTVIALTPSNLVEAVTNPLIGHFVNGAYVNNNTVTVNSGTFTATFDTFSPFVTGANIDATGLRSNADTSKSTIYTGKGSITVENAVGQIINIYSFTGSKVLSVYTNSNKETLTIGRGVYLLTVGSKTQKIVVQ